MPLIPLIVAIVMMILIGFCDVQFLKDVYKRKNQVLNFDVNMIVVSTLVIGITLGYLLAIV